MAKMKAESLYQHQQVHGTPLRSYILGNVHTLLRIMSAAPRLSNYVAGSKLSKFLGSLIGLSKERTLPKVAAKRFSTLIEERKPFLSDKKVVLFNDTYNEFNAPQIGKAAVHVLEKLGYEVIAPPWSCCGRAHG